MRAIDFDRLRNRLLLGGVKPKYALRTVSELKKHHEDLKNQHFANGANDVEAGRLAFEQLGSEEELLSETLAKPELKTLAFRFQKSIFIVLPVFLYPLLLIPLAILVTEVIPVNAGIDHWEYWPEWYYYLVSTMGFAIEYLIAPIFALVIFLFAKRRHVNSIWPFVGVVLISFLAAGWDNRTIPPGVVFQRADLLFHWGYAFMPWRIVQSDWVTTLEQLLRIVLNCGLVAILEWRYRQSAPKLTKQAISNTTN